MSPRGPGKPNIHSQRLRAKASGVLLAALTALIPFIATSQGVLEPTLPPPSEQLAEEETKQAREEREQTFDGVAAEDPEDGLMDRRTALPGPPETPLRVPPRERAGAETRTRGTTAHPSGPPDPAEAPPREIVQGTIMELGPGQVSTGEMGILIQVDTPRGPQTIELGPSWFLDQVNLSLVEGETVNIIGLTLPLTSDPDPSWQGPPALDPPANTVIVAEEVTRDETTWRLRGPTGEPLWAGAHAESPEAEGTGEGNDTPVTEEGPAVADIEPAPES